MEDRPCLRSNCLVRASSSGELGVHEALAFVESRLRALAQSIAVLGIIATRQPIVNLDYLKNLPVDHSPPMPSTTF
jgi:hypothetical protein